MTKPNKAGTKLLCERPKCEAWLGVVRVSRDGTKTWYDLRDGFICPENGHSSPASGLWVMTKHAAERLRRGQEPGHRILDAPIPPAVLIGDAGRERVVCPLCDLKQEVAPILVETSDSTVL